MMADVRNNSIISHQTLKSKRCPRCHGRLFHSLSPYGEYDECINCGYTVDTVKPVSCASCSKQTVRRAYLYIGGKGNTTVPDCGCKAK